MPNWVTSDQLREVPQAPADTALRKYFSAEKLEAVGEQSARRMRFVISTADVDRDNDTIDPTGWNLANYKNNPVVLWAHSHHDLPIARAVEVGIEGNSLVAVAEFATYPFAETVFQLLKGGFLRAVSVGFRAVKYSINEERRGIDFKEQELLEFSVCPVPANPMALVSASAEGVDLEPMRKWMQDMIEQWPGDISLKASAWSKLRLTDTAAADVQRQQSHAEVNRLVAEFKREAGDVLAGIRAQVDAALAAAKTRKDEEADTIQPPASDPAPAPEPEPAPEPVAEATVEPAPEAQAPAGDQLVLDLTDEIAPVADDDVVLELADDPLADMAASAGMTEDEFRRCMGDVTREALAEVVRGAVKGAIDRARGRLD